MALKHWILPALICILLLTGCMPTPEGTRPAETFRLGEDIAIAGVNVSRLSVAEARALVQARIQEEIEQTQFTLHAADGSGDFVTVHAAALPIAADVEQALASAAWLPQHNGLRRCMREIPVQYSLDAAQMDGHIHTLCGRFYRAPVDATAQFAPDITGYFQYTEAQTGREIDAAALLAVLSEAAESTGQSSTHQVPAQAVAPAYTAEMARAERQCIATFTTSYKKSPHNAAGRVFNIKKAASLINGVTVQPGEEFDINAILGPRNGETGWKKAAGIRDGKYQQEYGGGVCQVSTTLFNAVMMADLVITERHPHSWPSGYVDIGRDATISTGGPNFRFVNSGSVPITVVAETSEDKSISISIYGKPHADGNYIVVTSERTGTLPALGTKVLLSEALPAGTRVEERDERRGKTSRTYKEYYAADGTLLKRETAYEDTYRSIQGITYVSADLYYKDIAY